MPQQKGRKKRSVRHSEEDEEAKVWVNLSAGGEGTLNSAQCVYQIVKHWIESARAC